MSELDFINASLGQKKSPKLSELSFIERSLENIPEKDEFLEQAGKSSIEAGLGTFGDIADILHAQTKERMLPGQLARAELEAKATPEQLINLATEPDIIPEYARLPSSEEIREMTSRPEPTTPSGRYGAQIGKAIGTGLSTVAGIVPTAASVLGSAAGQTVRELGGPEGLAIGTDIGTSIAGGGLPGLIKAKKGAEISKTAAGLPERKFETVKKTTKVSPIVKENIAEKTIEDFKKASESLMKENKVFRAMKEFPDFENKLSNAIESVEDKAKSFDIKVKPTEVVSRLEKIIESKTKDPFLRSSEDRAYMHYAKKELEELKKGKEDRSIYDLYNKFRKNNADRRLTFEPSKSIAKNEAKKDVLGDVNKAITEVFEEKLPDSDFPSLFKFTNRLYEQKSKINVVNDFLDSLGKGDINFNKASKYFGNSKTKEAITSLFGKDTEAKFSSLLNDFLSKKEAFNLLKASKDKSLFPELIKGGVLHYLSPELGFTYTGAKIGKEILHRMFEKSLEKPKLLVNWKNALDYIKKGQMSEGIKILQELKQESESD